MGLGINALGLFIILYALSMILGIFSGNSLYLIIVCAIIMSMGFQGGFHIESDIAFFFKSWLSKQDQYRLCYQ